MILIGYFWILKNVFWIRVNLILVGRYGSCFWYISLEMRFFVKVKNGNVYFNLVFWLFYVEFMNILKFILFLNE